MPAHHMRSAQTVSRGMCRPSRCALACMQGGAGCQGRCPVSHVLRAALLFACRQVAFDDVPAHHNGSAQTFSSGMGARLKQELQAEMTRLKRARSAASIADSAQVSINSLHSHETSMFMGCTGLLGSHTWSSERQMHAHTAL